MRWNGLSNYAECTPKIELLRFPIWTCNTYSAILTLDRKVLTEDPFCQESKQAIGIL